VLQTQRIFKSDETKELMSDYQENTNPVALLIKENGYHILSENIPKKNFVKLSVIYNEYKDFANEIRVGTLSRQNFKSDMLAIKGVKEFKYHNVSCFNLSTAFLEEAPSASVSHTVNIPLIITDKDGNIESESTIELPAQQSFADRIGENF
jgi:hypothetical protein